MFKSLKPHNLIIITTSEIIGIGNKFMECFDRLIRFLLSYECRIKEKNIRNGKVN